MRKEKKSVLMSLLVGWKITSDWWYMLEFNKNYPLDQCSFASQHDLFKQKKKMKKINCRSEKIVINFIGLKLGLYPWDKILKKKSSKWNYIFFYSNNSRVFSWFYSAYDLYDIIKNRWTLIIMTNSWISSGILITCRVKFALHWPCREQFMWRKI